MTLSLLIAFQAAAAAPAAAGPAQVAFDLAKYRPGPDPNGPCARQGAGDIVVCGRREGGGAYPFEEMERLFREKPIVAETSIAPNTTLRAYGESVDLGQGQVSKPAMVGVRLRF
jgi:hypothetical protein